MRWVRVHSHFDIWAANGPAPTLCITSDDDGEAFIEIAKQPELLSHPYSDPNDPWNCFFSNLGSNDGTVATATIQLNGGRADYTLPNTVWQNMSQVANAAAGQRLLYYRVRARPRGTTSEAYVSHSDTDVAERRIPYLQVLPLTGDLRRNAPVNDAAALAHLDDFSKFILAIIILLGDDSGEKRALQRLLNHPTYEEQQSPTIRAKVLKLFVRAGGSGRQVMERLLDLRVPTGSSVSGGYITEPALYHRDERNEGTTLDHLLALWDVRLDPRVPIALSDVIYEVMIELLDPPGQVNQGRAGSCAATSLQCYVAMRNPAEYARWCRYILDSRQNHRVQLARNGQYMTANPEAFDTAIWEAAWRRLNPGTPSPADWAGLFGRSYSERGVQAAIMDYGNYRYQYNPERDSFDFWIFKVEESGLWEFEISRAVEAMFNQPWVFDLGGGSLSSIPNATAASRLISHFSNGGLPCVITMQWGTGGHAVLGLRVENNRVIFKNPQYRGGYPPSGLANGSNLTLPTRTVHNVRRAEESMDVSGLQAAIRGYCIESGNQTDRGYTIAEIPAHLQSTVSPTA